MRVLSRRLRSAIGDLKPYLGKSGPRLKLRAIARSLGVRDEDVALSALEELKLRERTEHYHDALARWHRWEVDGFLKNLKSFVDREGFSKG